MLPGNIGIVGDRFEMLHIHVFFVTPLGARHMPEPCTDQHQSGIPIGERANYAGSPANFPVQSPLITRAAVKKLFTAAFAYLNGSVKRKTGLLIKR